ncbi:conserved protein of unknown function precursor containing a type A C-terminal secretion signal. Probable M12B family metalloprotease [Tenacibaculum sp. 190130A14a]|uniref:GEVED domain-containing protein n=1 Tax=Tenacibaculum polynesiense TaxID=3137857 RepID=UPI003202AD27
MKNKFTLLIAFLFVFYSGFSQTNNFWKKEAISLQNKTNLSSIETFSLEIRKLKNTLLQAPKINNYTAKSNLVITFPNEFGELIEYRMFEKSNLHPELANKFPNAKSYIGSSVKENKSIYLSVNQHSISGVIIKANSKPQYIKPVDIQNNLYTISSKTTEEEEKGNFNCGSDSDRHHHNLKTKLESKTTVQRNANDATLRTYRFAIATTAEFSQFYINQANVSNGTVQQKKAAVIAGLNATLTIINAVYERDLSVRFELVANNDALIFLDTNTDGFTHDNSSALVNEAHGVISNTIGNANFDIGHVVDLSNRGGFGGLGVLCNDSRKGTGASTANNPTGNFFYGLFLHEIGHQLGAQHTFNNACNGNRVSSSAFEPGSGSTIMSYSGVCAPNVINDRDTYFHAKSIEQMWSVISNTNCATLTNTGNTPPTANAGNDFTIPKSTPFVLKGTSSDANNAANSLTHTWEQIDAGTEAISPYAITGPAFRSLAPSSSAERYFPAIGGVSSGYVSQWESLPAVSREMNFRLTVRDNHNGGASTASDDVKITVNDNAGPFVVTSPNTDQIIWTPGTNENITWDVAGTTSNGINATTVDILLSIDGGITFNTTLASNVPNDGSHQITVPNTTGSQNRIMVKATNHIFYDMSNKNFFISNGSDTVAPSTPTGLTATNPDNDSHISAKLNWTASTDNVGIAGYIIVQNGEEIFTWNSTSTSDLIMRGLNDGTDYAFQIIAFDAAGNRSAASAVANVKTTGNAPTAPLNVIATNITQTGASLSWDPSTSPGTHIDGYSVFVNGVFTLYTKDVTPDNLTSAVLNTLNPGRTYSITIGAVDGNNIRSRKESIPIEVTTLEDNTPPSTPTNLVASVPQATGENPETSVDLDWTAATDNTRIAGYIIEWEWNNGTDSFTWNSTSAAITMRGLTPATAYTFRVRAFDAAGNTSELSGPATITTAGTLPNDTTPPSNVTNLQVNNITTTTANLTWNAATDNVGVTGYDIFRGTETTAFATSTTNSFQLIDLTPGSTTTYVVKAKDAAGNTSVNNSNTVTVTTLENTDPTYCDMKGNNSNDDNITNVTFAGINKTSSNTTAGYHDYTDNIANVTKGETQSMTVTFVGWQGGDNNEVYVWIDWNKNGLFTDAGEKFEGTGTGSIRTVSITTPNTATTGNTRIRVVLGYNNSDGDNACTNISFGEVEDYTISISNGGGNNDTTPPSNVTGLQAENITQTTADLTWNVATDNIGVTGYDIFRGTETSPFQSTTTNSFQLIGLSSGSTTTYVVKAKDAAGNISVNNSNTVSVTTLTDTTNPTYCAAGHQGTNYIAQVTFGSINNSSTNNSYTNFTNQSTTVQRGQSLSLTVTPGITANNWSSNVVAAWIDWNRDGTFSIAERVLLKSPGVGGQTTTVTVPNDAQLGITRLRVRYRWASNPNPCGTSSNDGNEVEDYNIIVNGGNGNDDTTPPSNVENVTVANITQTTADLSWTLATDNIGVTGYDIFRNAETTAFASSTTASFQLTGLAPGSTTTYVVKAKDAAGNTSIANSNTVTVTTLGNTTPTYCSAGASPTANYIGQVIFGTINNTTTSDASYSDFTSQSTTVQRGQSVSLTVNPGISFWSSNVVAAWIDWNQDGTFSTTERILIKSPGTGGQTTTVTVPNDAQLGTTRLRVRYKWAGDPNPCGTASSDGDEVEDYTVNVTNANSASPGLLTESYTNSSKKKPSVFPNPFNENVVLNINSFKNSAFNLGIYDLAGREIFFKQYNGYQSKIENIGDYIKATGTYIIRITSEKNSQVLKVIKK